MSPKEPTWKLQPRDVEHLPRAEFRSWTWSTARRDWPVEWSPGWTFARLWEFGVLPGSCAEPRGARAAHVGVGYTERTVGPEGSLRARGGPSERGALRVMEELALLCTQRGAE